MRHAGRSARNRNPFYLSCRVGELPNATPTGLARQSGMRYPTRHSSIFNDAMGNAK